MSVFILVIHMVQLEFLIFNIQVIFHPVVIAIYRIQRIKSNHFVDVLFIDAECTNSVQSLSYNVECTDKPVITQVVVDSYFCLICSATPLHNLVCQFDLLLFNIQPLYAIC